ncbi:MAG: two component signal transduction system histidine kinase [Idiomarinaceae bacterium HL-53]|nr:MAG: two component signal transduction system histidine kinase [Idiomarinaceae bacterium HL-53]
MYFVITFIVTCAHIFGEYSNTKRSLALELENQHNTFSASLTRSMWEFNSQQIQALAEGLISIPAIGGLVIRDDRGQVIAQMGQTLPIEMLPKSPTSPAEIPERQGIFGHYSPLAFEFSGQSTLVGDITLFSNREVAIERLKVSLLFLLGNAIIKTTFLLLLFTYAFNRMLTRPLQELTSQIEMFRPDAPSESRLRLTDSKNNEFGLVEKSFNELLDKIGEYQQDLQQAQEKLVHANRRLDEHNDLLEQEVARKTSGMSKLMLDLEERRLELEKRQYELEREIQQRRLTEATLKRTNERLRDSIDTIKRAQSQLVESEKLASLGGLVASVAHDVNTPIGIGVTATSFLADRVEALAISLDDQTLTQTQMHRFIDDARESVQLLENNLHRARELMSSFKEVAVDQSSDAMRDIALCAYINNVVKSLHPKLKKQNVTIDVNCDQNMKVKCLAGALAQILTNMIMNSVIHGFEGKDAGHIRITVRLLENRLHFVYEDDGLGMTSEQLAHLFDPFFTTKADRGGSGLGTHIIYTLVRDTLKGEVDASSEQGKGLTYTFSFPVTPLAPSAEATDNGY